MIYSEDSIIETLKNEEKLEIENKVEKLTKDIEWVKITRIENESLNGVISFLVENGGNELIGFKVSIHDLDDANKFKLSFIQSLT